MEGAVLRLRPIMMTMLVATLGLLPAALSHDIGSDSQRPFAIVIVGGLISDLLLSIVLLPTFYVWIARDGDQLPEPEGSLRAMTMRQLPEAVRIVCAAGVFGCLLLADPAFAQQAPVRITLDQAIQMALQHNHTLQAARTTIQQNQAAEITANLRPNPTFFTDWEYLPLFTRQQGRPWRTTSRTRPKATWG